MNDAKNKEQPTVLVATDLSEEADEAIREAHEWAVAHAGRLVACHVVPEPQATNPLFPQENEVQAFSTVEWERKAGELLAQRVAEITGRDADDFEISIDSGDPETVILGDAAESAAELIVLSPGPRRGLGRIARHVLRFAHCSVLVARAHRPSSRVLTATDLSDPSLPAITAGAAEAARRGARLTVLHNLDPNPGMLPPIEMTLAASPMSPAPLGLAPVPIADLRERAEVRVRALLSGCGVSAEVLITEGDAATEIARAADDLDAELLVVGTHGRSGLLRMALGSVAERVVETAHSPLLVVRLGQASGSG